MIPEILYKVDRFMLLLKRYAKLNFALFLETSPFFRSLVKVIDSIKYFSRVARGAMTLNTKALIIWIILTQIRKFSMGDTTILSESSTMHTKLSSKKCLIINSEEPINILGIIQRKRTRDFDPMTDPIKNKQKGGNPQGKSNPITWYPLLKSKVTSPIEVEVKPLFSAVLKYCGKAEYEVYPLVYRMCAPNALAGRFYLGDKFTHNHRLLNDSQVSKVLDTLKKFTEHPAEMKQG